MVIKKSILWAAILIGLAGPVQANQRQDSRFQQILNGFASGFVPPEEGAPKKTTTAGSRDEARCRGDHLTIRSLMPKGNYGLTIE